MNPKDRKWPVKCLLGDLQATDKTALKNWEEM